MDGQTGSTARVGFVMFIATLLAVGAVFLVGDGGGLFQDYRHYRILFPSTYGLRPEARVYLDGVPVGKVVEISFSEDPGQPKIRVSVAVQKRLSERIRQDSFAWIQSEGLLGDKVVQIKTGDPGKPELAEGAVIEQKDRSAIVDFVGSELVSGTADLLENMIALLREVNAGKGTMGQLLRNPELYANLNEFTKSLAGTADDLSGIARDMKDIIGEVREQKGTLGKLIFSEEYALEFTQAVQGTNRLIDSIGQLVKPIAGGKGAVGRLVNDEKLAGDLGKAIEHLASVAGRLDGALRAMAENRSVLGRLIEDPETGKRFERLVLNLERSAGSLEKIFAKVEAGEGSLGMLVQDPSIMLSIRDLFLGVRESSFLLSVARRAEETGRAIRIRDERLAHQESLGEAARGRAGAGAEGSPQPATSREGEGAPAPAPSPPRGAGGSGAGGGGSPPSASAALPSSGHAAAKAAGCEK